MSSDTITQFHLSLRLPPSPEIASMPPSSYWGITVATRKATGVKFSGRSQEEILALVVDSAATAARKAVAENDRRGLPTPVRGDDGNIVYRLRGEIVAKPE